MEYLTMSLFSSLIVNYSQNKFFQIGNNHRNRQNIMEPNIIDEGDGQMENQPQQAQDRNTFY